MCINGIMALGMARIKSTVVNPRKNIASEHPYGKETMFLSPLYEHGLEIRLSMLMQLTDISWSSKKIVASMFRILYLIGTSVINKKYVMLSGIWDFEELGVR